MAETKRTRKTKKKSFSLNNLDLLQVLRLIFLISLAVFIVYLYYLHTKGSLQVTIESFWKKHQKTIEVISGIAAYSGVIYFLGYQKGKKH